jgi:hypothetical protein
MDGILRQLSDSSLMPLAMKNRKGRRSTRDTMCRARSSLVQRDRTGMFETLKSLDTPAA